MLQLRVVQSSEMSKNPHQCYADKAISKSGGQMSEKMFTTEVTECARRDRKINTIGKSSFMSELLEISANFVY